MSATPLPCPFCGSDNVSLWLLPEHHCRCDDCGGQGSSRDRASGAIDAWNCRAAETARDHAIGLLSRWLSQHRDGGSTDPCGVAEELVAETREAVRK